MDVRDFDFDLPSELIAQEPPAERGSSRLLHIDRATGAVAHARFESLPDILRSGDLLVVNNTRVFPARLVGRRVPTGGAVECLLVRCQARARHVPGTDGTESAEWEALMHPGQKLQPGAHVVFEGIHTVHGEVLERRFFGRRSIRLWTDDGTPIDEAVGRDRTHAAAAVHQTRRPRRRSRPLSDRLRADARIRRGADRGTAFHAGDSRCAAARAASRRAEITLHVGYGTFQPVRVERVEDHRVDPERYEISRCGRRDDQPRARRTAVA